jgi:hypothetical protein
MNTNPAIEHRKRCARHGELRLAFWAPIRFKPLNHATGMNTDRVARMTASEMELCALRSSCAQKGISKWRR